MAACRRYVTIEDPEQLVLTDLPFTPGQQVEVLITAADAKPSDSVHDPKALLKETQAFAKASRITDEEIAAEVQAYRSGR